MGITQTKEKAVHTFEILKGEGHSQIKKKRDASKMSPKVISIGGTKKVDRSSDKLPEVRNQPFANWKNTQRKETLPAVRVGQRKKKTTGFSPKKSFRTPASVENRSTNFCIALLTQPKKLFARNGEKQQSDLLATETARTSYNRGQTRESHATAKEKRKLCISSDQMGATRKRTQTGRRRPGRKAGLEGKSEWRRRQGSFCAHRPPPK